jgi:hypothetical protein
MPIVALFISASVASPALTAQNRCPIVGDTITITGQVSIRELSGLKLPELRAKTFPNRFQPICIQVKPYIGAGVGVVDRVVGDIEHIWLLSPKQESTDGKIDWTRPDPIATGVFLEISGKLIGQSPNRLEGYMGYEVMLEVSSVKNIDAAINNAVTAWKDDCMAWVKAQLDLAATWKNPPRDGERPRVRAYHIEPFASMNGTPEPKCAASVEFNAAKGGYFGNWSLARFPYVVDNLGGVSLSDSAK